MPLCSVEVPRGVPSGSTEEAKNLATEALKIAHDRLEVPDPNDLEINVVEGMGEKANILVSCTVGPNEYPKEVDPSFYPAAKQINTAGQEIQAMAGQSGLNVTETTIQAWENTTFILRNPKAPELTPPNEDLKSVGTSIEKPSLKLLVSPSKQQGPTILPREAEPTTEPEPNLKFTESVGKMLSEAIGLPEDQPFPVLVQPTLFADTDYTVVFDCQPISGYQIPEEVRVYMAQLIEQELNQNPSTIDGSAEVWIRQGQPVEHHFTSK